jgi:hypothetical protein
MAVARQAAARFGLGISTVIAIRTVSSGRPDGSTSTVRLCRDLSVRLPRGVGTLHRRWVEAQF